MRSVSVAGRSSVFNFVVYGCVIGLIEEIVMSELNKFSIDDVSKEELLSMVDKGYAAMMAVIGIDNLSMDMKLSDVPGLLKEKFLPGRTPQSEWVSVEKYAELENEINSLKEWVTLAFEVHPNIDVDIENLQQ